MIEFLLEKYNEFSSTSVSSSLMVLLIVFAILGFLKGAVRLVFFVVTLAGAAFAAYWGCEFGLDYIRQHWATVPDVSGNVIGAICGFLAFMVLRKIFGILTDPMEQSGLIGKFAFGIPAAIVSTVIAAGLVWFGVNQLRDKGTQDEMKYWISQNSDEPMKKIPVLAKLKNKFEDSAIGKGISSVYHMQDDEQHNLARLVVLANTSREKLSELKNDPAVQRVFRNEKVRKLLIENVDIQRAIDNNNPKVILENPELLEILKDPGLRKDLQGVSNQLLKLNQE